MADLQDGREKKIRGPVPLEVQPLVDGFNAVLARNAQVIERARQQTGNLAHAIKTPLAVLAQAAEAVPQRHPATTPERTSETALSRLVIEQVALARRQVDWHLARARAAGAFAVPGHRVVVEPVVRGLMRVMDKVHAGRALQLRCGPVRADIAFAGEEQDLQEMLGNLLDNACKWARQVVQVEVVLVTIDAAAMLQITVQDCRRRVECAAGAGDAAWAVRPLPGDRHWESRAFVRQEEMPLSDWASDASPENGSA